MLAGAAALGGGIAGLASGAPADKVQLPQMFQMPNMGAAAGGAFGGIGNLSNYNTWNIPGAQGVTNSLFHNPYAGGYQQGANQAGGLGQLQALNQYGVGQGVTGMGMNQLAPGAGAVMNTAFDPQQALYQRSFQQNQQQQGAQNAAAGVGTTPYGAGLANQSATNFNIDWQNQQLGRQVSGLGAAGGALQQAGGLAQLGQGLSASAPGQYLQSSAIPYSAFSGIGQGQLGALTQMGQFGQSAAQLPMQQIQDYLGYLGAGNQAGSVANQLGQLGLNQSGMAFGQNAAYAQMIAGGMGRMGGQGFGIPGLGQSSGWGQLGQGWGQSSPYATPGGYGGGPYGGAPGTI